MKILTLRIIVIKLAILTSVSLILSCSNEPLETFEELEIEASAAASPGASSANSKIIKDQYIVMLSKKPAKADRRAEAALEALTKEVGNMPNARIKNVYKSTLTGFAAKLNSRQLEKIKKDKRVLAVYPDQIIELKSTEYTDDVNTTNVQEYATWGLDRIDQRETIMDRAYSYSATGKGVDVYIMDSGIRYSHAEFGTRASSGVDLVKLYPEEYDQDDPELELGNDCNGHGTHVAATVGGKMYGVAKEANLISVRVFSCVGRSSSSRIIQAIEWVTNNANANRPAVVNMSLGGGAYEPIDAAVETSVSQGIHYVVSAGNNFDDACNYSPARTPGAITVGATDINNFKANFSNFGDCLDVYAPGYAITSASHKDNTSVISKSGTSMAAPHVAGLAALYLQNNTSVTPTELENQIILNSTPDVVQNVPAGPNRMVYSLWEPVVFSPPIPPALNLKVIGIDQKGENQFYLVWDRTEDPVVDIYQNGSYIGRAQNTGELSLTSKGKGDDTFMVCEVNFRNCSAEVMADFSETDFVPNQPPTAAFTYEINDLQVTFTDQSTDSDGTIVRRRLYFGDGYYTTWQSITYTYKEPGVYRVELWVEDDHGNEDVTMKEITVGTVPPSTENIELTAVGSKVKGQWQTSLSWTPAGSSAKVDIYRNGHHIASAENTGRYNDVTNLKGGGSLTYKICEAGTKICSNEVVVHF